MRNPIRVRVKAVQQKISNYDGNGGDAVAYVIHPIRYSTIKAEEIIDACVELQSVPRAHVASALTGLVEIIIQKLAAGHSVQLPGLGTFSLSLKAKAVIDEKAIDAQKQFEKVSINFRSSPRIKKIFGNVRCEVGEIHYSNGKVIFF